MNIIFLHRNRSFSIFVVSRTSSDVSFLQVAEGHVFNMEAARRALQNLSSLDLFSNITLNPRVDEEKETGIVVEINLKEHEQKSAEVSTEWSIIPGPEGRPTLVFSTNFKCFYSFI